MKTRILISVLAIGLSIALIGGATMAWFTDEAEVPAATFTAGTVDIEVGEERAVVWETPIVNWNPGDTDDVNINFKTEGSKQTYVRATVDYYWCDDEGNEDTELIVDNIDLTFDNTNWVKDGDYYYYTKILDIDDPDRKSTTDLITEITLDGPSTTDVYQGKTFKIIVTAQAIQASNGAASSEEENGWGVTLPDEVESWPIEEDE